MAYTHILGHIPLQNRADDKPQHSPCHKNPGDRECRKNFQNIQVCRLQKVIAYQETYNAKKHFQKHIYQLMRNSKQNKPNKIDKGRQIDR